MKQFLVLITLLTSWFLGFSCQPETRQNNRQPSGFEQNNHQQNGQSSERKQYSKHRNHSQNQANFRQNQQGQSQQPSVSSLGTIPAKVYDVLNYVRQNRQPKNGYVGGRRFGNFENHLPRQDVSGRRIDYQEWDVNPKQRGINRGTERLITGSDGRAWFTVDHYNTFTEVNN